MCYIIYLWRGCFFPKTLTEWSFIMPKTKKIKQIDMELNTLPTTSSKIRYLDSKNLTRSQIAKELNIRYQHVRNVLITPIKKQKV